MVNILHTLAILAATATTSFAHWNYDRLIINGQIIGEPYQYIRKTNNSNHPFENVNSTDFRCNSGGASGLNTQTYTVAAGDMVGFTVRDSQGHPGPFQSYLSKAPKAASEYDGSGDWAKIYTLSYSLNSSEGANEGVLKWATHRARSINFKLPAETPPGEYLLRAEGLALHPAHKPFKAQFYISCAQINVTGNGNGTPGPTIKFPGGYHWDSPGVLIPEFWSRITNYTSPGPALWPEGTQEAHVLNGTKKTSADQDE